MITKYITMMDENRHTKLVKESEYEYDESVFNTGMKLAKMVDTLFHLPDMADEHVYLVAFDIAMHITGVFEVSHGGVCKSACGTREIFQRLLLSNAASFAVIHNHTSGCVFMSSEDKESLSKLKDAGNIMGINIIDFIIVARHNGDLNVFSAFENGMLKENHSQQITPV